MTVCDLTIACDCLTFSTEGREKHSSQEERMPNAFGAVNVNSSEYGMKIVAGLAILALVVVVAYALWPTAPGAFCPKVLRRDTDGSLTLDGGQYFPDMNAFQQWWYASKDYANCPLPILTGAKKRPIMRDEDQNEQTYAKTPIYKVDDYEFSRIFGYERGGHMEVPRQEQNLIINQRQFDWPDKPYSSDERRAKYKELHEGFDGEAKDLKAMVLAEPSPQDLVREATQRHGEHRREREVEIESKCRLSREEVEVADLVAKAYEADPDYEPVVTKVGPHNWEVNELKPLRRKQPYEKMDPANNRVVDTANDATDIAFEYREKETVDSAIDPYFTGDLPSYSAKSNKADPYNGPVPGLERMFGPTFDQKNWY